MGARNLGTQIEKKTYLEKETYLYISSVSSIEPIRALFLDTTRGLTASRGITGLTYIDNHIYCNPKYNFRIVLVSQSIVLQFLKEV